MFTTKNDAKVFLANHGLFEAIDLDDEDEIVDRLYRDADSKSEADSIVREYADKESSK